MSKGPNKDIKTQGYVLKRTNYGEADRILNIITPLGKKSVMARGVRKAKSKLAGGIEMFTLTRLTFYEGKGEIGVLTGAKMVEYYGEIVKNYEQMEFAAEVLRRVSRMAEGGEDARYFEITQQVFRMLNQKEDLKIIRAWFLMNLAKEAGEEMNLYRDATGEKLLADKRYVWDEMERAFREDIAGGYGADEIKMLRILMMNDLQIALRVRASEKTLREVLGLIEALGGRF